MARLHTNLVLIEGDCRDEVGSILARLGLTEARAGQVIDYTEAVRLGPEGAAVGWVPGTARSPGFTVIFDASLLFAAVGPAPWSERLDAHIERELRERSSAGRRCLHFVAEAISRTWGVSVYEDGRHERAWLTSEDEVVCDEGAAVEDLTLDDPEERLIELVDRQYVRWAAIQAAEFRHWTYDVSGEEESPYSTLSLLERDDSGWQRADASAEDQVEEALRWRLILGQFADERLGFGRLRERDGDLSGGLGAGSRLQTSDLSALLREAERLDQSLEYIYDREFARRSHRQTGGASSSGLSIPAWLAGVRDLFPEEAVHVIERDALSRYGMTELVTDPEILRTAEPSEELMKAILQFKHLMSGEVLEAARQVVRKVVDDMALRMLNDCAPALYGVQDPEARPPQRTFRNIDWRRTILRNLKNYDRERGQLVADRFFFKHRQSKKSNWRIIISVDQSGSMMDSLIHSSIMAAIFCTLPSVEVHLVLWDTRIVDATPMASDPLEVLMKCQLGGGTDMLPAMKYCADLITEPERTLFVLVSDWYIWGEREKCLAMAHELHEAGVVGLGLCALDADARPIYDERFARDLAGCGWFVAALTPKKLAEHVSRIIA